MSELLYQLPTRYPGLGLVFLLLIVIEFAWMKLKGHDGYDLKETGTTIAIMAGQVFARGLAAAALAPVYLWAYKNRLLDLDIRSAAALAALFLLSEFSYYWFHRFSHTVRWMWTNHSVHHSSTKLNFTAAGRLGWTNLFSGGWLFLVPLAWLGFPPVAVLGMFSANLAYQFFLHTEMFGRLGPLEWIFNTPAHHRVHHATNEACRDRNFGGVLIVFDRLFGTFAEAPEGEKLSYGLAGVEPSYNPFKTVFAEWIALFRNLFRTRSPGEAWQAVFGRP